MYIIRTLRILSSIMDPTNTATLDRTSASNMIYSVEYDLLLLNKTYAVDSEDVCTYSCESAPLQTAAHVFLYIVIRELPSTSQLMFRLVKRLKEALESQPRGWWVSSTDRRNWLLWMLFMGGAAASEQTERQWFVKEMVSISKMLGLRSRQSLKSCLQRILWQESFGTDHCTDLWEEMEAVEDMKKGSFESYEEN